MSYPIHGIGNLVLDPPAVLSPIRSTVEFRGRPHEMLLDRECVTRYPDAAELWKSG